MNTHTSTPAPAVVAAPVTSCDHGEAVSYDAVPCGAPQQWYCEVVGGCGQEFTTTKKHDVYHLTRHAATCERPVPASWCGCERAYTAECVTCGQEFPRDVTSGADVTLWS